MGENHADNIYQSANAYKADGDGYYDINFTWLRTAPFSKGESARYEISGPGDLEAADFYYLSKPAGGKGPYYSAAHVQSIDIVGNDNDGSGWIAPNSTPEPGTLLLLGSGLMGFVGYGKLRLRRKRK